MKTIQQKRLALLEETVKHYSKNPMERRCTKDGKCRYSAETLNLKKSTGCAIGRKLTPKKRLQLDKQFEGKPSGVEDVFDELPKKLQELGEDFLSQLQGLHDTNNYWDEKGLTEEGKQEVENIVGWYC